jgi:hypothetical protein
MSISSSRVDVKLVFSTNNICTVMQHRELAQVFVSGVQMLRYIIHSMLESCT